MRLFLTDRGYRRVELHLLLAEWRVQARWPLVLVALGAFAVLAFVPHYVAPNVAVGLWLLQTLLVGCAALQGALLLSEDTARGTLELRLLEFGSAKALLRRRVLAGLLLLALLTVPPLVALAAWFEDGKFLPGAIFSLLITMGFGFALGLAAALRLGSGLRGMVFVLLLGALLIFAVGDTARLLHPLTTPATVGMPTAMFVVSKLLLLGATFLLLGDASKQLQGKTISN